MRCVFSETLNGRTLDEVTGAFPEALKGGPPVRADDSYAVARASRSRLTPLNWALTTVLSDLVTTCFPGDCRVCADPLLRAGRLPVCERCLSSVSPQTMTLCRICGEAMGMESDRYAGQFPAEGVLCTVCRFVPPAFERAVAYSVYEDQLRTLIHLLKYERMRVAAPPLGALLAQAIRTLELHGEVAVIAVPLYPAKERQRGYNQAVLLSDGALAALRQESFHAEHRALVRTRDTEQQFALNPRMRRLNLRGAFAVQDATRVTGRTVLLIDDIYTTGATARECARVLLGAGAARVFVATLARAQAEQVGRWDFHKETDRTFGSGEAHT